MRCAVDKGFHYHQQKPVPTIFQNTHLNRRMSSLGLLAGLSLPVL
uniref:Uncharacterized protein n=1 Tax=Anguilla anguilla TaxID=7936 RepID=A0A0E9VQ99_ANGAN